MGTVAALRADAHLRNGLNVCAGMVTDRAVADTFELDYVDPLEALDRR
jgi:alanine dehydrogenase